jgi:hypothetical protein
VDLLVDTKKKDKEIKMTKTMLSMIMASLLFATYSVTNAGVKVVKTQQTKPAIEKSIVNF